MYANCAAEAVGRTLATRLLELTDDPGMKDMLTFLIARDTMHQQQWLAVIEELEGTGVEAKNAPGRLRERAGVPAVRLRVLQPQLRRRDHGLRALHVGPVAGRQGHLLARDPAPALGEVPLLQPAPPEVHAGAEATGPVASSMFGRIAQTAKEAVGVGD